MLEIRRCRGEEIGALMAFIDRHWKKGHALAVNRTLMDWQHSAPDGSYDYMIAMSERGIVGVLGYISTRRFDPYLQDRNVLWLALWKVLDDAGVAGLGLRMLRELNRLEPHVAVAVSGINPDHPPMYKALRYRVGELTRFYAVNPGVALRMIRAPEGQPLPKLKGAGSDLVEMDGDQLRSLALDCVMSEALPGKTPIYFVNRFLRHPIYRYRVFLATGEAHRPALLAMRVAEFDGARALRIVDFAGDPVAIAHCGSAIAAVMDETRAEYVDFWQSGLPDRHFLGAGFEALDPDGQVIVPNYFEPFEVSNGRILCAFRTATSSPFVIFRADGDQDRPS